MQRVPKKKGQYSEQKRLVICIYHVYCCYFIASSSLFLSLLLIFLSGNYRKLCRHRCQVMNPHFGLKYDIIHQTSVQLILFALLYSMGPLTCHYMIATSSNVYNLVFTLVDIEGQSYMYHLYKGVCCWLKQCILTPACSSSYFTFTLQKLKLTMQLFCKSCAFQDMQAQRRTRVAHRKILTLPNSCEDAFMGCVFQYTAGECAKKVPAFRFYQFPQVHGASAAKLILGDFFSEF